MTSASSRGGTRARRRPGSAIKAWIGGGLDQRLRQDAEGAGGGAERRARAEGAGRGGRGEAIHNGSGGRGGRGARKKSERSGSQLVARLDTIKGA